MNTTKQTQTQTQAKSKSILERRGLPQITKLKIKEQKLPLITRQSSIVDELDEDKELDHMVCHRCPQSYPAKCISCGRQGCKDIPNWKWQVVRSNAVRDAIN